MVEYQDSTVVVETTTAFNTKREFHNDETSTYWLPKDDGEQKRLTGQHFIFKKLFGGVSEVLDFEKGVTILDAECGSDVWVMDMIHDHPNCTYYGCDIADTDNAFDFVHMRLFIAALREDEWPAAINEVLRVAKPGGMIQLMEYVSKQPKDTSCLNYKVIIAFRDICTSIGQNSDIGADLEHMLSIHSNLRIVQSDFREFDMSSSILTAKRFIWDALQGLKNMQYVIGPMLEIATDKEYADFLYEYERILKTKETLISFNSVAVQKL
ncbi:hypothetical protein G6F70_003379 [Rhizopus microsporus]|nr:hypothetical protein G6F71_003191 [Rhizopus microsporus]KAG1201178.1 hypothetical protein G6F70_003379 [Rhizopus microsporus]KAG1213287.1 hypothetical protein G6F69_002937 [Rhizopus microsporus]KAG1235340.1 hypothetical protein G6F67_002824 [Rhizopus microsporus]KAG1261623.1 hypothetical protein G6F68_006557 [Rhizopus microsporus]